MDQFSKWPPIFDKPPSPSPNISETNEDLFNHDFILQCIKNGEHNTEAIRQQDSLCDITNSHSDRNTLNQPRKKRVRTNSGQRSTKDSLFTIGILRNSNIRSVQQRHDPNFVIPTTCYDDWLNITLQNNRQNAINQDRWRGSLELPIDLSRETRSKNCCIINDNWTARYDLYSPDLRSLLSVPEKATQSKKVRFLFTALCSGVSPDNNQLSMSPSDDKENAAVHIKKRSHASCSNTIKKDSSSRSSLLINMQDNLLSRAERKITRIATWNINNGFDHLAIASIMAKKDIDILALQEPRISHSTTDDVWIATMRKELRKCKYEIITSQFSYLIFDEQTSGAALVSII